MRRFPVILLLLTFVAIGSGSLARVHDLAHAQHDGRHEQSDHDHAPQSPTHDETNCELHALLRAPLAAASTLPILILPGPSTEPLTQRAPALHPRRVPVRTDCRGPPLL